MVQKIGLVLLAGIAILGIGMLTFHVNNIATGQYYASGGGRWWYGPQIAQLDPDQACTYSGHPPSDPWRVETNEYNTLVSVCADGARVPTVQTIIVP